MLFAANSMRYCACSVAKIGDPCADSERGTIECTLMPSRRVDEDCTEFALSDHAIAKCAETSAGTFWQHYDSCGNGSTCRTDGEDFECHYTTSYGCNDEPDTQEPSEW